jgi:hypothetical protein
MAPLQTLRGLPRAIIAAVFACLVVLQAVASPASPAFAGKAHNSTDYSLLASSGDERCTALGEKVPGQRRHDHSPCCIFCKAPGRDAFDVITAVVSVATDWSPEAKGSFVIPLRDHFRERPEGWESAWSSRAPPLL